MAHEIVFVGSSELGLRSLLASPNFTVVEALCLTNRLTPPLTTAAGKHAIPWCTFEGIRDFRALVERHPAAMPFFIYQLDMLVPADLTEKYNFYNVHRGDLRTNRGPNPDVWPILNGSDKTALSLHKINDKVDSGILIDAPEISIVPSDDAVTVREKLEERLPAIIESLHEYLHGKRTGTALSGGTYRPWITEADFTLDLQSDPLEVIDRKIRSQRQYNGAIIQKDGQKYYVTEILGARPEQAQTEFYFNARNGVITTRSPSHALTLKWNEQPKYPPPPVRPPSKRV
jgi:methionyl-tRNA formyltransferase